jgi:sulfur carrier protein ThiS
MSIPMTRVVVAASGDLRRYLLAGEAERVVELAPGATLDDLTAALGADPNDAILARRGSAILREGAALADGDRIELFAPVGGG